MFALCHQGHILRRSLPLYKRIFCLVNLREILPAPVCIVAEHKVLRLVSEAFEFGQGTFQVMPYSGHICVITVCLVPQSDMNSCGITSSDSFCECRVKTFIWKREICAYQSCNVSEEFF